MFILKGIEQERFFLYFIPKINIDPIKQKFRSYQKELLDNPFIPFRDIKKNMEELAFINHRLGGHHITLQGVKALLKNHKRQEPVQITEIGCGGGNNLFTIQKWAEKNHVKVELTGIDINKECIAFAKEQPQNKDIRFICSDYRSVMLLPSRQVVFSSLFCHHFTDEELVFQLKWMYRNSSIGFFINDLHRHPLAYYSIKLLTSIFSKSYLVKNDAPLSVERGFIRKEWSNLFQQANIEDFTCQWKWAFRWLVICRKK
ncbi:methyltransferase domain-containing protein [Chitinophagaceae bacterium LB-8]|uniref:Methyltransferase domain-containing protein n=1 Tax=Paraflavisolibacter caeni TaxID=2982496 RepID=A0A9X2XTF6_9BACT|nr:methyltransferase domain-containing protein [Paraflavisolibacter caeni]MCU7548041.1 methyltransferase domain-containing protein [Paraflavisolibacter caeni]